jgi:16S rRNA (guanine966-N2)-methyltransferase
MRVISGFLGGRNFDSPPGYRTHPMSEKMRGGLFSALGDISGLSILDVYSGSGALAIESISRGAKDVTAIEADKSAYETIEANLVALEISDKVTATKAFFKSWSNRRHNLRFDLVLADPPYNFIVMRDIVKLPIHLKDKALMVLSWPGQEEIPRIDG